MVMFVGYCPKCGSKVSDEDYFCSKCGTRTREGAEAGVTAPAEELREALSKMGQEMEKAFSVAAREIHEAFKTAGDNVRRSASREPVVCSQCGEKNASDSTYCYRCGEKIDSK
jgi:uncharacterized membrane protein YvbJ